IFPVDAVRQRPIAALAVYRRRIQTGWQSTTDDGDREIPACAVRRYRRRRGEDRRALACRRDRSGGRSLIAAGSSTITFHAANRARLRAPESANVTAYGCPVRLV